MKRSVSVAYGHEESERSNGRPLELPRQLRRGTVPTDCDVARYSPLVPRNAYSAGYAPMS